MWTASHRRPVRCTWVFPQGHATVTAMWPGRFATDRIRSADTRTSAPVTGQVISNMGGSVLVPPVADEWQG